mmetsp:Transcript_9423/g.34259  ORF Transcript_9423/g.34259 Transcript_9423/m.34259 type:complete len:369 (-) Transcript_9423:32-1138(-)
MLQVGEISSVPLREPVRLLLRLLLAPSELFIPLRLGHLAVSRRRGIFIFRRAAAAVAAAGFVVRRVLVQVLLRVIQLLRELLVRLVVRHRRADRVELLLELLPQLLPHLVRDDLLPRVLRGIVAAPRGVHLDRAHPILRRVRLLLVPPRAGAPRRVAEPVFRVACRLRVLRPRLGRRLVFLSRRVPRRVPREASVPYVVRLLLLRRVRVVGEDVVEGEATVRLVERRAVDLLARRAARLRDRLGEGRRLAKRSVARRLRALGGARRRRRPFRASRHRDRVRARRPRLRQDAVHAQGLVSRLLLAREDRGVGDPAAAVRVGEEERVVRELVDRAAGPRVLALLVHVVRLAELDVLPPRALALRGLPHLE